MQQLQAVSQAGALRVPASAAAAMPTLQTCYDVLPDNSFQPHYAFGQFMPTHACVLSPGPTRCLAAWFSNAHTWSGMQVSLCPPVPPTTPSCPSSAFNRAPQTGPPWQKWWPAWRCAGLWAVEFCAAAGTQQLGQVVQARHSVAAIAMALKA